MAQKKKIPNRWAGREEFVNDDVKRLRHMSAEEIKAYYDQVEPVADGEVQEIFDRVMPKISYEIATIEQKKQPRHARGKIGKTVLVAVCLTLMFSVLAQALGVPVWETIVIWANDCVDICISRTGPVDVEIDKNVPADERINAWGDNVEQVFEELGVLPYLPTYIPEGFEQYELFYREIENGYIYMTIRFKDQHNHFLKMAMNLYCDDRFIYHTSVEYDKEHIREIVVNDTVYRLVSNLSNNSVSWDDEFGSYCLSSNIEFEVIEDMIRSIKRNEEGVK